MSVLALKDLRTHFHTRAGVVPAVDGVSFTLERGRVLGLVGESGSGKSVTGFSILGLVDPPGRIVGGSIRLDGQELVGMPQDELRQLRGRRIAMVFQDPTTTLNPVLTIGQQMTLALRAHEPVSTAGARGRARDALGLVGIPSPEERLDAYPHQFSGGMRQRVAIAIAMLHRPDLIIADEPTTALDVSIRESGTALLWITHDLAVISSLADEVCVMYAGRIVERGRTSELLERPRHPYTRGLLDSVPSLAEPGAELRQIPGTTPSLVGIAPGCAFRARCARADGVCSTMPELAEAGRAARCHHPLEPA
jgi:peptide/nickel transport system ATP-binding protein